MGQFWAQSQISVISESLVLTMYVHVTKKQNMYEIEVFLTFLLMIFGHNLGADICHHSLITVIF